MLICLPPHPPKAIILTTLLRSLTKQFHFLFFGDYVTNPEPELYLLYND